MPFHAFAPIGSMNFSVWEELRCCTENLHELLLVRMGRKTSRWSLLHFSPLKKKNSKRFSLEGFPSWLWAPVRELFLRRMIVVEVQFKSFSSFLHSSQRLQWADEVGIALSPTVHATPLRQSGDCVKRLRDSSPNQRGIRTGCRACHGNMDVSSNSMFQWSVRRPLLRLLLYCKSSWPMTWNSVRYRVAARLCRTRSSFSEPLLRGSQVELLNLIRIIGIPLYFVLTVRSLVALQVFFFFFV
jgi:hypothetical protein